MAFDLVQYFSEQIKIQKPQLFGQYSLKEKQTYIDEVNVLALGQLISLWKQNPQKLYQEVHTADPLYIQEVARHLTTSAHNQSALKATELEKSLSDVLALQLTELKQLDQTGSFGQTGLTELLLGQIEIYLDKQKTGFGQPINSPNYSDRSQLFSKKYHLKRRCKNSIKWFIKHNPLRMMMSLRSKSKFQKLQLGPILFRLSWHWSF